MVAHDELMRRAIEGLRASRSPSFEVESRLFAALEQQLGGPPGGGGSDGGGGLDGGGGFDGGVGAAGGSGAAGSGAVGSGAAGGATMTIGWVAKVAVATASLTTGGLLALYVGSGAVRGLVGEREPVRDQTALVVEAEPERAEVDDGVEPSSSTESVVAEEALPPIAIRPSVRVQKPTEPIAVDADALAAEFALLAAAKQATTPSVALEHLERHARDYPEGSLRSEREALAVLALCKLERTNEALARARPLIEQRSGSPLVDRLRKDCPALADAIDEISP